MAAAHFNYFTLFPQLPIEIRLQIWQLALEPEAPGRVLFCFKDGCWKPRRLTAADPHFNPVNDEFNLTLEFRHELLDVVDFELVLFSVSREAQSVACQYIESQKLRRSDNAAMCVFVRGYDTARDVLFIPTAAALYGFLSEHLERLWKPDLEDLLVYRPDPSIVRLAVTPCGLDSVASHLWEVWELCSLELETLYIVANAPENTEQPSEGQHWEILSAHDAAYVWDASAGQMAWHGEHCIDGPLGELFALMETCAAVLPEKFIEMKIKRAEMRAAYMVRR
ncbi:hypothetical protein LEL_04574 [Akanthomyces lecanii RCEF 1005]|uniref:2EXR domain-containing protein n=1 Tax=Akanthomyces lecanii RCEF 1005 TaxID=1081108 RepID=A0A168HGU1_CORDF|nr:hypothetical protein LEL_04574 [Akanthomyces lecanii RCEF 1005]